MTVCTAVWFSATLTQDADVIAGASLTFVTVTTIAFIAVSVPSLTCTVTS